MKTLVLVICAVLLSAPAYAVNQYNITNKTCAEVQSILKRDGIAQLRYPSPRNPSLTVYDRYVSGSRYCRPQPTTVPTANNKSCRVHKCRKHGGR